MTPMRAIPPPRAAEATPREGVPLSDLHARRRRPPAEKKLQGAAMPENHRVAFALGGLAGNNAHGAGFLQAALERGVRPDIISCTSGQLRWAYHYLESLDAGQANLEAVFDKEIGRSQRFHNKDLDLLKLQLFGLEGVYHPAYLDIAAGYFRNWLSWCQTVGRYWRGESASRTSLIREFFRLLPAHLLTCGLDAETLREMSDRFNASAIGVAFNSYNAGSGREHVYLNAAARRQFTADDHGAAKRYGKGRPDSWRDRITYQDITPEAVRDALWLYYYGFEQKENSSVDGAYFRQIMLSELTFAETIYVVRPVHFHWTGALPSSYADVEDFKTRLNFNGSYAGERYQINLINKLVGEGLLGEQAGDPRAWKYHHIELVEIEIEKPRDFFDYVFEDPRVFADAKGEASRAFAKTAARAREVAPRTQFSLR